MKIKYRGVFQYILLSLALILVYFLAGKLGLTLAYYNDSASPVWPPVGVAVVALFFLGYRFFPFVFVGAFLVNYMTTPSLLVSLGIAFGNTLEAVFAVYLFSHYAGGKDMFSGLSHTALFVLVSIIAPVLSASLGVLSLYLGGYVLAQDLFYVYLTWFVGNVMGILLIFPFVFSMFYPEKHVFEKERYVELFLAFLFLLGVLVVLFYGWPISINLAYNLVFLSLVPLLWIAVRFSFRTSTFALFFTSVLSIFSIILGTSPFLVNEVGENMAFLFLQFYLGVLILIILFVSVSISRYKLLCIQYEKLCSLQKKSFHRKKSH